MECSDMNIYDLGILHPFFLSHGNQVGVVGDGNVKLDSIGGTQEVVGGRRAISNSVGGTSKTVQKNAFGQTTGYADTLKEKGLVDVDE